MVIPSYVLCAHFGAGVYTAWTTASAYCFMVGLLMLRRFRSGRWKALRVIEAPVVELEPRSGRAFVPGTPPSR
jgi:Na+-driven multidrug efflux pump